MAKSSIFDKPALKPETPEALMEQFKALSEKWWKGYVWLTGRGAEADKKGYVPLDISELKTHADRFDNTVEEPLREVMAKLEQTVSREELLRVFHGCK